MADLQILDPSRTLADLVSENPARATVLDRAGLDFCCHGQRSLADACAASGVELADLAERLDTVDPAPTGWSGGGRASLASYVEETHHSYLHAELPSLVGLAAKVRSVHNGRHPELIEVATLVASIAATLEPHLAAEEIDVFPAIAALAPGRAGDDRLSMTISHLQEEHEALGVQLARLRELTGGYRVPADGCASYQSLYERLERLEADTHVHVHLENNILFPAALVEAV